MLKRKIYDTLLVKRRYKPNYIKKTDSSQELEFLIEQNCAVIPIEVKSKKGSTLSLNQFLKDWQPPYAYKLTGANIGCTDQKISMPHYMTMFI